MNTPSHDKSATNPNPSPKFELTPLDNRRHQSDHQNFRDTSFEVTPFRSPYSSPVKHSSTFPMKSSVIHQQQHPHTAPHSVSHPTMQPYSAPIPSVAYHPVSDQQHSASNHPYPPQSVSAPPHLSNTVNHHQSLSPHHNQQQHSNQHQLHPHSQPPPPRPDPQQKVPPPQPHTIPRYSSQRPTQQLVNGKSTEQVQNVPQATMLPHMPKVQPSIHVMSQQPQQMPSRFQQVAPQSHLPPARSTKAEGIPSMPLPMHPDPIQSLQPTQEASDGDRAFSFGRHGFFDELPQEDNPTHVGLPPPHPNQESSDQGNTLAGVDSITGPLGMPGVPGISNLSLPGISGPQNTMHGVHGFSASANLGNAAIAGGASEIAEALAADRKGPQCQRRMRPMPRARNQQMTESQRKQRHNEHTRASRSRIDKGLERLKNTIRKVQPDRKVTKKADVLQVAVKLLKEGYRLPATESDEERDEPPDSALSV